MTSSEEEFRLLVPQPVRDDIVATHGAFCERLSGINRHKIADDVLSQDKACQQARLLQFYAPLQGKRVLEVGSGLGTNLITWSRMFGADMYGVEPDATGFDSSFANARALALANDIDPNRIVNAIGESLPFESGSFDVVFSSNVLEHTQNPAAVLQESLRVLRPGGVLQFIFPNYCSYYEGHYGVFQPPILWSGLLPWYIKWIRHRDPAFARTLRTELNVGWVKRELANLRQRHRIEVVGLGQDVFLERVTSLDFAAWASLGRIKRVLGWIGNRRIRSALGHLIVALRGWTPIILTLRKTA